jgi:hypothetical protein
MTIFQPFDRSTVSGSFPPIVTRQNRRNDATELRTLMLRNLLSLQRMTWALTLVNANIHSVLLWKWATVPTMSDRVTTQAVHGQGVVTTRNFAIETAP